MSKEILIKTLQLQKTERPAWIPYVGVHGAYLIGEKADDYLKSADLIVKGFDKGVELYQPDGLPILFDLQLEAEALGCELAWADDNPPAVATHILDDVALEDLKIPTEQDGRIPIMIEAIEKIVAKYDEKVGIVGMVCGPFTLGLHLMGAPIITKMLKDPETVITVMTFCGKVCEAMCKMYLDRGIKIMAIVDPMVSQISPKFFDKYVVPAFEGSHKLIKSYEGAYSMCFVCGNATRIVPNLAALCTDGFAVDENIDFSYVTEEAQKAGKVYGGNLPLTMGMLFGDIEDNIKYTKDNMEKGLANGGRGFILAPGCDMPFFAVPENVQASVDVVMGRK